MRYIPLRIVSSVWSLGSALARFGVGLGILTPVKLKCRVISVGNIQVGGAGKTPLVAKIAREAHSRGLSVCILSRGYRSKREKSGGVIPPGDSEFDALEWGDEPALLHDLCPFAYLGVGRDRVKAYREAARQSVLSFDLVILDDGFQHWKIKKDVEVVALTSAGRSQVLFRDWDRALGEADLIVWTKGERKPSTQGKPLVRMVYRIPSHAESGPRFWLVTGIADSSSARALIESSGYLIQKHIALGDHASFDESLVRSLLTQSTQAGCRMMMTGKDWVKWRAFGVKRSKVIVLEPEPVIEEGQEVWAEILWGE